MRIKIFLTIILILTLLASILFLFFSRAESINKISKYDRLVYYFDPSNFSITLNEDNQTIDISNNSAHFSVFGTNENFFADVLANSDKLKKDNKVLLIPKCSLISIGYSNFNFEWIKCED